MTNSRPTLQAAELSGILLTKLKFNPHPTQFTQPIAMKFTHSIKKYIAPLLTVQEDPKPFPTINLIAITICTIFTCFWMLLAAKRYYFLYALDYWDLAFTSHVLWNILHGNFYHTLIGTYFPADHCYFICFLLLPFYWISPDPMLLQYFKIGAFFCGSYFFFLILKKRLNPLIALAAMIAYCIAPANIAMLRHIFNYEPFSIPFIFLIFKALDERNYKLYITCCFLLAIVKEQMPLVVMMFSILAFFLIKKDKFKWVWIPFFMGALLFILDVFIIMPYCLKDCHVTQIEYWGRYSQFGKTPVDIFYFILTHPLKVLALFITPLNAKWYHDLFGIFGGLAILSPQILLPAAPLFLKTLLSNDTWEHVVTGAWYAATFTPFIYLAVWNTLNHIQNKGRNYIHSLVIILMLLHAFNYWPEWKPLFNTPIKKDILIYTRMINKVPAQAAVLSDFYTVSFLANRKNIYEIGDYLKGKYYLTDNKFGPLNQADYILINFSDDREGLVDPNTKNKYIPKITKLNFNDHWILVDSIEDIALYKKTQVSLNTNERLIDKSYKPFKNNTANTIEIDNTLNLEALEFPKYFPKNSRIFPVTMYWKCLRKTQIPYKINIKITSNAQVYYEKERIIGSTIYPANFWKKNEYIKEKYFYLLPHLQPGKYLIKIIIYNPTRNIGFKEMNNTFIAQ